MSFLAPVPDHVLVLAALVDKGLCEITGAENLRRWLPGWNTARVYRTLHALETRGHVEHVTHGFWRATSRGRRDLRTEEQSTGRRAIPFIHDAIERHEAARPVRVPQEGSLF